MPEQQYVLVATDRETGKRVVMSEPVSRTEGTDLKRERIRNEEYKRRYKHFTVAEYPYVDQTHHKHKRLGAAHKEKQR